MSFFSPEYVCNQKRAGKFEAAEAASNIYRNLYLAIMIFFMFGAMVMLFLWQSDITANLTVGAAMALLYKLVSKAVPIESALNEE
jgi:hypothetical protein